MAAALSAAPAEMLGVAAPASFNVLASVSIILVNKHLVTACGFEYLLTLLFLNFSTTAVVLVVLSRRGWFQVQHLPPWDRWILAMMATLTVLLNNASNEANSVGFYQITKLLIIPTVIVVERLRGVKKSYSTGIIASLCVASAGVAVATVSDFEVNLRGSVLAALSVFSTAQYQIWQGSKQHEHGLSAMQITHSVGWPQTVVSFAAAFIFDVAVPDLKALLLLRTGRLLNHTLRGPEDLFWMLMCSTLAVLMNLSAYSLLGKAGPVTYQVIGQVKTCLIVVFGYVFFDVRAPAFWLILRFCGVCVAMVGVVSYATLKSKEEKQRAKAS